MLTRRGRLAGAALVVEDGELRRARRASARRA